MGASNPGGIGKNHVSRPISGFIACCQRPDRQCYTHIRWSSLLYWTWVELTLSLQLCWSWHLNVKAAVQFRFGRYPPDLDPVIPDWQIPARLVQWEPVDRNYALVWHSIPSVFAVCSIDLWHCVIRIVRPTYVIMIPSCASACQRPNPRWLQPSWLHVSKVSINGWDPTDWN